MAQVFPTLVKQFHSQESYNPTISLHDFVILLVTLVIASSWKTSISVVDGEKTFKKLL